MRVVIVNPEAKLGDFCAALPSIAALREYYPGAEISLVATPEHAKLCLWLEIVDKVYDANDFMNGRVNEYFDLALLSIAASVPYFKRHTKAKRKIGPFKSSQMRNDCHISISYAKHLEELGLPPLQSLTVERFTPPLKKTGEVLIHPGASEDYKRFDCQIFHAIYETLIQKGEKPVLIMGPKESAKVKAYFEARVPFIITKSVVELAERIVSAKAYIGNDTGSTQLAGFLGCKTGALFKRPPDSRWMLPYKDCFNLHAGPTEILSKLYAIFEAQNAVSTGAWE